MFKATITITTEGPFDETVNISVEFDPPLKGKDGDYTTSVESMATLALEAMLPDGIKQAKVKLH